MSDEEIWAHVAARDSVVILGLKKPSSVRGIWRNQVLISVAEKERAVRSASAIGGIEVLAVDTLIPWARVKIRDLNALRTLRRMGFVDYLEPNGGGIRYLSDSSTGTGSTGCSYNAWGGTSA